MSLLRRVIGSVLRRVRQRQGRTLREVAEAAGVSLPYLSEVERGRKEASSEVLAAICRALGINLSDLLEEARDDLRRVERRVPAAPRAALARLDRAPAARTDTGPRLRIGFHADTLVSEPRAAGPLTGSAPVATGRLLRLGGATVTAGDRLPHVGGANCVVMPPVGLTTSRPGTPVGEAGLRVRLLAPAGPRTPRMLARRRARAGLRRLLTAR
ncbi:helix-turn-helix domain-containing protein [Micromonospora sp. KC723]|uniref:helix-turn-helix domain-containing protein n=1 Tax=Micromonospora sp. KC723 TaxID=2530381 RepID=UPI0010536462|nr:helix-turn-helix transcriptional regulator [Micromonospora sp. KC723]TDB77551.1 XRE family transcriptional regulator [Micromonospora sp. KC723]